MTHSASSYTCVPVPAPKYGRRVRVRSPKTHPIPTQGTPSFETSFPVETPLSLEEYVEGLNEDTYKDYYMGVDNPTDLPEGIYRNRGYLQHLLYSEKAAIGIPSEVEESGETLVAECYGIPLEIFVEVTDLGCSDGV